MLCGACCSQTEAQETVVAAVPTSAESPALADKAAEPVPAASTEPEPAKEEPAPAGEPAGRNRRPSLATAPTMFSADLELNGEKLGIDINFHDGATLLITKVNEGPCMAYNRLHPDQPLLVGDRFVVINGAQDEVKSLLAAVKENDNLGANLRRAVECVIHIVRKDSSDSLGVTAVAHDLMCLTLTDEPVADSLLGKHNAEDLNFAMHKGDFIMRVNGVKGDPAAMLAELNSGEEWEIAWRRIEREKKKK